MAGQPPPAGWDTACPRPGALREEKPSSSRLLRFVLIVTGCVAVGLGMMGVFVPVLPTTPLVILAAACFARSSDRFHRWLLNNRLLGPILVRWRQDRSVTPRTRIVAMFMVLLSFGVSIVMIEHILARLVLLLTGLLLIRFLLRIPARAHPGKRPPVQGRR